MSNCNKFWVSQNSGLIINTSKKLKRETKNVSLPMTSPHYNNLSHKKLLDVHFSNEQIFFSTELTKLSLKLALREIPSREKNIKVMLDFLVRYLVKN